MGWHSRFIMWVSGLSVETVFKHFYPAAVDRYNETGSIRQVCEEEGGGGGDREGDGLGKAGLQVFTKFNPMLGTPLPLASLPPSYSNGDGVSQRRASTRRCRRAASR